MYTYYFGFSLGYFRLILHILGSKVIEIYFRLQLWTIAIVTPVKTTELVTTLYTATSARVLMVLMEQTVKKVY